MLHSMTGFAALKGAAHGHSWGWDLRSVNAKGLDLRLRVPDWIDGLEPALRAGLGKALARGSVTLALRVQRDDEAPQQALNPVQLATVLEAMAAVEAEAMERGLALAPSTAGDVLALKGVMEAGSLQADTKALRTALLADLPALIDSFNEMRRNEGEALDGVLKEQLATVAALTDRAA
ncbi:YicC/YloC family endoribonuclease, partial [Shimia sp.]|uniref:YicC/YloC family endoribonuclease n=1 Tax=Shimia sp. TaxID=1954381 RepID=UPI003561366C